MPHRPPLNQVLADNPEFDVVVIGGGITGAGIAREAAGSGLRTLLVEQQDFAWGTSSRSSKMVHGGLRYLGSGQPGLAREALRERERLLQEAPGLIDPMPFVMPHYRGRFPGPRLFQLLLRVYDYLGKRQTRRFLHPAESLNWVPALNTRSLLGASVFADGVTDDARLVLRVLSEAREDGAVCRNYTRAVDIRRRDGRVTGVSLQDVLDNQQFDVKSPLVINATGAWGGLPKENGECPDGLTIRPLRGSHLVLPWQRLPVTCAVSLLHPEDGRPVFAFPWQGTTVLGTTDLDHNENLAREPAISATEVDYLLQIAARLFPSRGISQQDIVSTWSGVRPVVTDGTGKSPSKENREHTITADQGLVTIAGGKLTTFRQIAREALSLGIGSDNPRELRSASAAVFRPVPELPRPTTLTHLAWHRLRGCYGPDLPALLDEPDLTPVPGTDLRWAELTFACKTEQVVHLDDLLLRRTRFGLILPDGGERLLPQLREQCQPVLGWSDQQWIDEVNRYRHLYREAYSATPWQEARHDR
ncbi:FAD dependent oxidoreductase [Marinobacter santoriniensis NKSG1]|uniref:FAD dependent oxidoreductase n=1 Tax=Marinobacter santoriniensis NKSG1 TaxID=1288826 RepID=M7CUG1_9GAMM|nr:glycerol-3-phosphate dehydrogenase/oxidase [Marinobacter santoriniensis]EMP56759.1 FAD dependent oxidoreductase [Marinobacter santoriniensis NKSG1]